MISLDPLPTEQFLALPDREQQLQAIGDVIGDWIKWTTRQRGDAGMETVPDTHVWLNGYEGAPPEWPSIGQLTLWLEVIRAGLTPPKSDTEWLERPIGEVG